MQEVYVELIQWRALERIFALVVGGLSIAAGWHLFLKGVVLDQQADVELPAKIKLGVKKAGPGVFFALFGAWLVTSVATTQASLEGIPLRTGSEPVASAGPPQAADAAISADSAVTAEVADVTEPPPATTLSLVYYSNDANAWQRQFVAASNTLANENTFLRQAIGTPAEADEDRVRRIRIALSRLDIARRNFLLAAFPPEFRQQCEAGAQVDPDHCQAMREYFDARIE